MAKKVKKNRFYKKESERTKNEKLFRAIVCVIVVIYTAILGYMLINANANLAEAESDFADVTVEETVMSNN
jgi:hypothetical protein